jgi:sporulation protein YlmC with PRC-barrel domain
VGASKLIGSIVYDTQNEDIGSVEDIVLDRSGSVVDVVIAVGSFLRVGGKYVSVPLNDVKMDNHRLTLDRSKEHLKSAPTHESERI